MENYKRCRQAHEVLNREIDAQGRALTIHKLHLPPPMVCAISLFSFIQRTTSRLWVIVRIMPKWHEWLVTDWQHPMPISTFPIAPLLFLNLESRIVMLERFNNCKRHFPTTMWWEYPVVKFYSEVETFIASHNKYQRCIP